MARSTHAVGAVLAACLLSAPSAAQEHVEIDLTDLAGRRTAAAAASRDLEQQPQETLDVYLRLPADSELRVELPDAPVDAPQVTVEGDGGRETLELTADPAAERRASLARFDREPVRIRFENRSQERPLLWSSPRIVGVDRPLPPILPPVPRPPSGPPNVVLYVVDTLRADRLSLYGYGRPTSPELEKIAARGIVFDAAYAASSHTSPSITALFSSRLPSELSGRLAPDGPARRTLAELFREAGYATAAFQANYGLIEALGFGRGFDEYQVLKESTPSGPRYLGAAAVQERALTWVRQPRDRPFFLYIQTMDVHFPYEPPPPFRGMFEPPPPSIDPETRRRLEQSITAEMGKALAFLSTVSPNKYDGAVAYADHEIGRFVAALHDLGLGERTVIVITADHGEPLLQRHEFLHGKSLYEELVRVPLLMVLPAVAPGRRAEIVSLMDLAPTLLDVAGVPVRAQFLGTSLLRPRSERRPPFALGELTKYFTNTPVSWFIREGDWKLIADREGARLFHLPTDPGETRDVGDAHPVVRGYLAAAITHRFPGRDGRASPVALDAGLPEAARKELREALKALGYIDEPP